MLLKRFASTLSISESKGIKTILLNLKPVNALTPELLQELHQELHHLHSCKTTKGLIFGSAFPKVLSAGLDLKTLVAHPEFYIPDENRPSKDPDFLSKYKKHITDYMGLFQECVRLFVSLPMPSIAVVRGAAPAGGTVLSLCCDQRFGSTGGFRMGLTEVQVGMAPPMWVHTLARNHLGNRKAAVAVQKGTMFKPEECLEIGYVDRIVEDSVIFEEARKELESYQKLPWEARKDAKGKSIQNVLSDIHPEGLQGVVESISGNEFQTTVKGILASLQKK
jgi:enoyl-CoA hydratase/carnithine racemase